MLLYSATLQSCTVPGHPPTQDDHSGNKRRRIDAVAATHLYPTAPATYGRPHLNYSTPQHHVPSYADGIYYVARQPQPNPVATRYSGASNMQHQQQQQQSAQRCQSYNPMPQRYVADYHDIKPIQQPYYYGQTDPSVYSSPWPPTQQDAQTGVHTPAMMATGQFRSMPYVKTSHSPVDSQQQSYDSGPSPLYRSSLQTLDVNNFGIAHEPQSQLDLEARKSPSDIYFEDACMHLKMESLPVLDSLVS